MTGGGKVTAGPTPGPWRHSTKSNLGNLIEGPSGRILFDGDDGYRAICTVQPCGTFATADEEYANQDANIRLIASAPDLLAALNLAAETIKSFDGGNPRDETGWQHDELREAWLVARRAIALARGEGE